MNSALLSDLIKILLPASLVLIAMYYTMKALAERLVQQPSQPESKSATKDNVHIITQRLQAVERLVLYLERVNPENMLLRTNRAGMSARELQQSMLHDIREEYNHNLAQQIYVSDKSWELLKQAKEEINTLINHCADELPADARSSELARKIIESLIQFQLKPIQAAIQMLKSEARLML